MLNSHVDKFVYLGDLAQRPEHAHVAVDATELPEEVLHAVDQLRPLRLPALEHATRGAETTLLSVTSVDQ